MFIALAQPLFNCVLVVSIKKGVLIPILSKATVQNIYLFHCSELLVQNFGEGTELGFNFTF